MDKFRIALLVISYILFIACVQYNGYSYNSK